MNRIILITLFLVYFITGWSQEYHFSQFYSNPLYLSSSYAGSTLNNRIVLNYRDQWPQIPNNFITYSLSFDTYFPEIKSGIGCLLMNDKKGELNYQTTSLSIMYAYDITVSNRWHIRPSLNFSYLHNSIDYSNIRLPDQMISNSTVPISIPEIDRFNIFDLGSSFLIYDEKYWFGFSALHLLRPYQSSITKDRIPLTFWSHGGTNIRFKSRLLKPKKEHFSFAYYYRQSIYFSQLDIGMMAYLSYFYIGLWYRGIPVIKKNEGSDAIIINFGAQYSSFTFGYSYDFTISGLKSNTNGAHEISVIYQFDKPNKPRRKIMAVPCPMF